MDSGSPSSVGFDNTDLEHLPGEMSCAPLQQRKQQIEYPNHSVHPELACETVLLPSPPGDSFTFVELFAGIGGFRLGLEALGGRCVFASEILPDCVALYEANFGHEPQVSGDICRVNEDSIPAHDLLVGGFPCQPFSSLGDQPGLSDQKGVLFMEIVRILRKHRPRAFLLENVPGLLTCDEGRAISRIISELEDVGYSVSLEKLDSRCLTAQSRYRVFISGIRQDGNSDIQGKAFQFPYVPDLMVRAGDILESDEQLLAAGASELHTMSQKRFERLRDTKKARLRYGVHNLAWEDTICGTLTAHYGKDLQRGDSQLVPGPEYPRRFTPRECARLMGFPEDYDLGRPTGPGTNMENVWCTSRYGMFGNAVCPPMIAAVAGAVLAHCPSMSSDRDWVAAGRSAAIQLALRALPPQHREKILGRLHPSFRDAARD
mmetsp:Transcript_153662/g.492569  ORF Transcript_153662/g.492569 Transcript_153662/m.492569 type:complete len:432 (+) Transcript_153662:82-1377(+)